MRDIAAEELVASMMRERDAAIRSAAEALAATGVISITIQVTPETLKSLYEGPVPPGDDLVHAWYLLQVRPLIIRYGRAQQRGELK